MIKCPICSQETEISLKDKEQWSDLFKDNNFITYLSESLFGKEDYSLYWCKNCDLIFTEPMKSPGNEFYENIFLPYKIGRILDNQQLRWPQKMFLKNETILHGKLLDIGCNVGLFISNALKVGYDVTGIDFDQKAVEIAKTNPRLKQVYPYTLEKFISIFEDKFDVISLFDVLEHLDNPREIFQQIRKILKIGGYVVLSIPNRERNINTFSDMDLPPHHLTQWNENSVQYLLTNFGFRIIKIDKNIKVEDVALYLSMKTSVGLVKKKVEQGETVPLPGYIIMLLRMLSKYKAKLVYLLGNIFYVLFTTMNKQSSTIYVLARLEK